MRTRLIQSSSDPVLSSSEHGERTHPSNSIGANHTTVLLHEAIAALNIQNDDIVLDATLGGAGHAREIAKRLGITGVFIGFDLDADAIERTKKELATESCHKHFVEANFRDLAEHMERLRITAVSGALFDLGWSGYQLAAGRGFSFLADEPLLMTYTREIGPDTLTAHTIVNTWGEESIADILFGWGEERHSRKIAHAIVTRRDRAPFETARDLAETIKSAVPPIYRFGRIHPATRSFQALRIAVNDELGALRAGVGAAFQMLKPEGRMAVISFHSIEDRIVKEMFLDFSKNGEAIRITKSPTRPSDEELVANPRARSAKLRVIQKN